MAQISTINGELLQLLHMVENEKCLVVSQVSTLAGTKTNNLLSNSAQSHQHIPDTTTAHSNNDENIEKLNHNSSSIFLTSTDKNFQSFGDITMRQISSRLPYWGGQIKSNLSVNNIFNGLEIENTCTIDYFLLGFWISSKISAPIANLTVNKHQTKNALEDIIIQVIEFIEAEEWDCAKSEWILKVVKLNPNNKFMFNLFGTEYDFISKFIQTFQEIRYTCASCSYSVIRKDFTISKKNDELYFSLFDNQNCGRCNINLRNDGFIRTPYWLVVDSLYNESLEEIFYTDIPKSFTFNQKKFSLLLSTMHKINHFTSVFLINGKFYFFDDLNHPMKSRIPKNSVITTLFFYVSELLI